MWDQNKDGQLENAELPAGEVRSRFFRIDLNSDQSLDEAEWNKYAAIFELAQNTMVALRPEPTGGAAAAGLGVQARLALRGQPAGLSRPGRAGQGRRHRHRCSTPPRGKLVKQARGRGEGNYYASPVGGDGKIYVASGGGVVTVFRAGDEAGDSLVARLWRADRRHARASPTAASTFARRRPCIASARARSPTARFGPARVALASCQCKRHQTMFSTGKMPVPPGSALARCPVPPENASLRAANLSAAPILYVATRLRPAFRSLMPDA